MMVFFDRDKTFENDRKEDAESEMGNIPTPASQIRTFKYLDNLIHSGKEEIVLESDIALDENESLEYEDGIPVDIDGLTIDGNGHKIHADARARIFNITGKNFTIQNCRFQNGFNDCGSAITVSDEAEGIFEKCTFTDNVSEYGGALYNQDGTLSILDCEFTNNRSERGGAITNYRGSLTIRNTKFNENRVEKYGGAISNGYGQIGIMDSQFSDNHADYDGGALTNFNGDVTVENTSFSHNGSGCYGGAVHNYIKAKSSFVNAHFSDNSSNENGGAISNNEKGILTIEKSSIKGNSSSRGGAICNAVGGDIIIRNTAFEANDSQTDHTQDISNSGMMMLEESRFDNDETTILNCGQIDYDGQNMDLNRKIFCSFAFLDEMIHSGAESIVLSSDITLDKGEKSKYVNGISLDVDRIVIDGNGHTIDACEAVRIFNVSANDIVLKNITLKNAISKDEGGAIYNTGRLRIINSALIKNHTGNSEGGGAIHNIGELDIDECTFTHNHAYNGSAINNYSGGRLTVRRSVFNENRAIINGSAINSYNGDVTISTSEFNKNRAGWRGGAVYNWGEMTLTACRFTENFVDDSRWAEGGAVYSYSGELKIIRSIFNKNSSKILGGAIYKDNGKLTIEESELCENTSQDGGAIYNNANQLTITRSEINENTALGNGGAISESGGYLTIKDSTISRNSTQGNGGAIWGKNADLIIVRTVFDKNTSQMDGGAIFQKHGEISIERSMLTENTAENGGAIFNTDGILSIVGAKMVANHAHSDGGAIYTPGRMSVSKSVLAENEAKGTGGAIYNNTWSIAELEDLQFDKNMAGSFSGDVYSCGRLLIKGNFSSDNSKTIFNEGYITTQPDIEDNVKNSGKIIKSKPLGPNQRDFTYLNELIGHSGGKIKLEYDIILNTFNDEAEKFECGIGIRTDDLVIDANGHTIDALYLARIFQCIRGTVKITNATLKNGFSPKGGGAICNNCDLTIEKSVLAGNVADNGASIFHESGQLNIFNSEILSNRSLNSIISNESFLEIYHTDFKDNESKYIIDNECLEYNFSIIGGKFIGNGQSRAMILNEGKSCTIQKTAFENNMSESDIINKSNLTLIKPEMEYYKRSIFNDGYILLKQAPQDFKSRIYGNGEVDIDEPPHAEGFDFGYLDKKIFEANEGEIVLDEDIRLENYEVDFYEGGIILDTDGLTIDGNGHAIDGREKSRIFIITANDITLKNIEFKNGHTIKNYFDSRNASGGAIKVNNESGLTIENCKFTNNLSEKDGGAIDYNEGSLKIKDSTFAENVTKMLGGAINGHGELSILESSFADNTSEIGDGGAINDPGNLSIEESSFEGNTAKTRGGAINSPAGNLNIKKSSFKGNTAKWGGAIENSKGNLTLSDSKFCENSAESFGGAISNSGSNSTVLKSIFTKNESRERGGAIRIHSGNLTVIQSIFTENTAEKGELGGNGGGAIHNDGGGMTIEKSTFARNVGKKDGGAIWDFRNNSAKVIIKESSFAENRANSGEAICSFIGKLDIIKSTFFGNSAEDSWVIYTELNDPNIEDCKFEIDVPDELQSPQNHYETNHQDI